MIARALAQLELGQASQALLDLESIAAQSTDRRTRGLAARFAIENLAAEGNTSRAQPLLTYLEQAGFEAELAVAKLQLALADARGLAADDRQAAIGALLANAKSIGQRFGGYWQNRAEAILVGSLAGDAAGTTVTVDLMLAEVRQLLAAADNEGAIRRLLQFRDNEAAAGRQESATALGHPGSSPAESTAALARSDCRTGADHPAVFLGETRCGSPHDCELVAGAGSAAKTRLNRTGLRI